MPRHPPHTLSNLITFIDHRRTGRVQRRIRQQPGYRTNNVSIYRQKGARRYPSDGKTRSSKGPRRDQLILVDTDPTIWTDIADCSSLP